MVVYYSICYIHSSTIGDLLYLIFYCILFVLCVFECHTFEHLLLFSALFVQSLLHQGTQGLRINTLV